MPYSTAYSADSTPVVFATVQNDANNFNLLIEGISKCMRQFHETKAPEDLDQLIRLEVKAYELLDAGDERRSIFRKYLIADLDRRYKLSGRLDDLERMIELLTAALRHCPPDNLNQLHEEALELRSARNPRRVSSLLNLANAIGCRGDRTGSGDNIERRIRLLTEVLNLLPSDHIIIVFNNKRPSVISLDEETQENNFYNTASEMHGQYLDAREEMTRSSSSSQDRSKTFGHKLMHRLQQMWLLVVSKVVTELEAVVTKQSRIWWCPTSFLTILIMPVSMYSEM